VNDWQVDTTDTYPHVRPREDLKPHRLTFKCWCGPTFDEGVWVHHSMDRREDYEAGRRTS
jgi:hypothetical protein